MSESPFQPPNDAKAPSPVPDGVPPITLREEGSPFAEQAVPKDRFQFSMKSLFLAATGVSVFVSLVAWLGVVFFMVTMMGVGIILVYVGTYFLNNRVILVGGLMMFAASASWPFMFFFLNAGL